MFFLFQYRSVLKDLNEQRQSALLTCTRIMLDISYAISYLPPGVLWGGRLKTWHVGALGTISSLIGLYQALSRRVKSWSIFNNHRGEVLSLLWLWKVWVNVLCIYYGCLRCIVLVLYNIVLIISNKEILRIKNIKVYFPDSFKMIIIHWRKLDNTHNIKYVTKKYFNIFPSASYINY